MNKIKIGALLVFMIVVMGFGFNILRKLAPPSDPIPDCDFVSLDDTGKGWKCWTKEEHDKFWAERDKHAWHENFWSDIKRAF